MKIGIITRKGKHFLTIPITNDNMKDMIRIFPFIMDNNELMDEINQLKHL